MKIFLLRLALVSGSILLWTHVLRPGYLHPALVVYLFIACITGSLKEPFKKWIQLLVLGVGALSCLVFMLVIPYSVYLVWFDLLAQGEARGTVSWTILTLASYLSLLACIDISPGNTVKPFLLFGLVQMVLLYILFRTPAWAALGGLLFMLYLLADFMAKRRPAGFHWAAITGAGITALALIFASLPIHETGSAGNRLIDHHISRQLRYGLGRYVPQFPLLYGVSGHWLGHGFSTVELGGRVSLSSRPIFSLEGRAGEYHYLRTGVYNHYSNNSWQLLSRINEQPGRPEILHHEPEQGRDLLRLTILDDFYTILPHTLESKAILLERPVDTAEIIGTTASGISIKPALLYGESIFLQLDPGPESGTTTAGLPVLVSPESQYLQVPATLDPAIHQLAGSLSAATAAEFMESLSRTLTGGFSYTLTPGNDQSGDNFLENFLFRSKEGYCVHFATATVILARLKGIPARYVTGYLVHIPDVEDESFLPVPSLRQRGIASGLNSHAWAELWFPGTGWLVYEATPAFRLLTARRGINYDPGIQTDDYSMWQLSTISGRQLSLPAGERPKSLTALVIATLLIAALLLILLAFALLGACRKSQLPGPLPTDRQLPVRFVRLGRRILAQTDRLGIPGPEQTGWLGWENQLQRLFGMSEAYCSLKLDCSIFRTVIFGYRKLDKADYTTLECLYRCLKELRKKNRHPVIPWKP